MNQRIKTITIVHVILDILILTSVETTFILATTYEACVGLALSIRLGADQSLPCTTNDRHMVRVVEGIPDTNLEPRED